MPSIRARLGGANLERREGRSRITNRKDELAETDGRTSAARRYKDLVAGFIADMGGIDQCSDIRLGLMRRLASVTMQASCSKRACSTVSRSTSPRSAHWPATTVRLSQRLGLERVARTVTDIDPLQYAKEAAE